MHASLSAGSHPWPKREHSPICIRPAWLRPSPPFLFSFAVLLLLYSLFEQRGIGGRGGKGLLRAQRRLYLVASACAVQRTLMPRPTMADNQSTIRRGWALCCGSLGRVTSVLCGRGRDGSRLQQQLAE